jgi:hypothetical protein
MFADHAEFKSATFFKDVYFNSITFSSSSDVVNAQFNANIAFAGASFHGGTTDFRAASSRKPTNGV